MRFSFAPVATLVGATATLAAPVNGTGNVIPDVIFGSGNANGSFNGETRNTIEVGLRCKQRYPAANVFDYDGIDTCTFESPTLTTNPANRSVFNSDWSVTLDPTGSSGLSISGFEHLLSFDLDPTAGVTFQSINPFIGAVSGPNGLTIYGDHAFGDNFTPNGGGTTAVDFSNSLILKESNNVAQQSSNLGFGFSADPDLPGS